MSLPNSSRVETSEEKNHQDQEQFENTQEFSGEVSSFSPEKNLKIPGSRGETGAERGATVVKGAVNRQMAFIKLQRTFGNQYASQVARTIQASKQSASTNSALPGAAHTIQRGSGDDNGPTTADGRKPATPSIAAQLSTGNRFGLHASIFVTNPDNENKSLMIDLRAKKVKDPKTNKVTTKITINKKDYGDIWARKGENTTWAITDEKARAAITAADGFIAIQDTLSYNYFGIGYKNYNCALLAEKILKAAGINRSAGLIFSTPSELVSGSKGGDAKYAKGGKKGGSSS